MFTWKFFSHATDSTLIFVEFAYNDNIASLMRRVGGRWQAANKKWLVSREWKPVLVIAFRKYADNPAILTSNGKWITNPVYPFVSKEYENKTIKIGPYFAHMWDWLPQRRDEISGWLENWK